MAGKGDVETGRARHRAEEHPGPTTRARLLRDVKPRRKLKVAWDTGNGAVGACRSGAVVDKLPGEHFVLNEKVDGTFPSHHPDPTVPRTSSSSWPR